MAKYDENLILGYVEGELSAEDRAQAEALLATDPQLSALVVGMVQDRVGLRALPQEVPPGDLVDDVLARVERGMLLGDPVEPMITEAPAARSFRLSRIVAYSGLAALLLISGGLLTLSLSTGGLLEQTQEHADVGAFFEAGGRSADARAQREAERLARAAAAARETPEAQAMAAAPPDGPHPTATPGEPVARANAPAGDVAAAPQPEAIPEMARSVQEMALAPATPSPTQNAFRFRRFRTPLMVRTEPTAAAEGDAFAEDADTDRPRRPGAGLRVKVLTQDPSRATQDVLTWATQNDAQVVDEEPAVVATPAAPSPRLRMEGAPAAAAADATPEPKRVERKVVMVRLEPRQALDFVQFLNRDGQEAGIVPADSTVRRVNGEWRQKALQLAALKTATPMSAASQPAGQGREDAAALALTERLEQLQQNVAERRQAEAPDQVGQARGAAAMAPAALGDAERLSPQAEAPETHADRAPVERVGRDELDRIAIADTAETNRYGFYGRPAASDWDLLFQYELPQPDTGAAPLPAFGVEGRALTVPVIISETPVSMQP